MLFYFLITIQKLINLLLKQKKKDDFSKTFFQKLDDFFVKKMDDFSKAIALLFFKNWTLFNNDFLSKKHLFHPR